MVMRRRADGEFPVIPPDMDFRKLSRCSDRVLTTISLYTDYERSAWIRLGEIQLREQDNRHRGAWTLSAYLLDATDFEHDSAHLLKMELVGVTFTAVEYGQTRFEGFIRPDDEDVFRVGGPDYNPLLLNGTTQCKPCRRCGKTHPIVPEGHYVPPINTELFNIVRGRRVEVVTGILREP
jgi:hypothetical protein